MDPVTTLAVMSVLQNELTRDVFSKVLKDKAVRVADLISGNGERAGVEGALRKLAEQQLVKVKPAVLTDYDAYVITADGLAVGRALDLPA